MLNLLYVFLSALTFRIRGGLRIPFTDKKFPLCKWWFAVWTACLGCILLGWSWSLFITGLVAAYMCINISGWGSYIGALLGGKISETDKDDLNITDFVQNELFPKMGLDYHDYPRLYGFSCLSLRGGLTTFILGLWLNLVAYMFIGLLQGVVYSLGGLICKYIKDDGKLGWKWSEWLWGAVLGAGMVLL